MRLLVNNLLEGNSRSKLEKFFFSIILLVLFKIIFPLVDATILVIINEILIFGSLTLAFLYFVEIQSSKSDNPISLTLNVGILSAVLFFITSLSSAIFDTIENIEEVNGIFYTFSSVIISQLFILSAVYILASFQTYYLMRQKRAKENYFNYLLIALLLASFSGTLSKLNPELQFVEKTFFIVSILLVVINSFRVSWIAFLTKKQKVFVLFISIIVSALFGLNFAFFSESNIIEQIVFNFSSGVRISYTLIMLYGNIYFGIVFFTTLFHLPTAGAFDQKSEEITSLIDLSKLMTQVLDFKELADSLTDATNKVCNSDSAWLVTMENEERNLISVNNIGYLEAQNITDELLSEFKMQLTEVLTLNKKLIKIKLKNDVRTYVFQAIIVAPLKVHEKTNGYLFAAKRQKYKFDQDEKKAVGAFADYAAIALENAKLFKESVEKERMENELEVARNIQSRILPSENPTNEQLEVDALFVPAFEVGGDYYDYFQLGNNKLGFVIADVSGKGVVASYIMAEVKGIFESLSRVIESPKELLIETNDILKKSLSKNSFVTALYGIIDIENGILNFARAGHMPLAICSKGKIKEYLPKGIGLGLDFGTIFSSNIDNMEIKLNNNDILMLYTDGVTESRNSLNEEFGFERLLNVVEANCDTELTNITRSIFEEVSLFSREQQQHDDITLVLFKWKNFKKSLEKLNG
ncbi:MAG: SpoIIE family protein phosphatase [Bacteroidetes bacterium]|nr:SpoIIE family protein phosphatase [Bacteroidota bacterium]MBU1114817.1 SpoIIE family protein phosphatase [Bacteroidota bacterium]MBU1797287.1 SpoIIE family protein phosphatase [Bacteroidota bacterium]